MISDDQQDQATLYALDLLSGAEAAAFERELANDSELQTLVRELSDAAAAMALTSAPSAPSASLKNRVMQQIAAESQTPARASETTDQKIIPFPTWIPWAIAAGLAVLCGFQALDRAKLKERLAQQQTAQSAEPMLIALAPSEEAPQKAEAMVAWEPGKQEGVIKIRNLPAAAAGKDYQLWAVDAGYKDPINAGIVRIGADGVAQVRFKPDQPAHQIKAFAISLEREGGVPKKEGPILLVGTA
jgi:anti-sigma-K factor RskA